MEQKRIISGLDVMKFIMAILIVDAHVKGSIVTPPYLLDNFIKPLESLAVPEFFVISSFLFFIKARKNGFSFDVLWNFEKRLVLLYLFGVIVWLPIILIQNDYGKEGIINGVGFFVRDFFFGHTFDASWFLGALITSMPIVWPLGKYLKENLLG